MLTIINAGIIVASVILIFKGLIFIHNKEERKTSAALKAYYNELAGNNNLTILNHEVFKDAVFGLDEICYKILVLKSGEANKYKWQIIDLNTVKNCSVIKDYKSFYLDEGKAKVTERYVDQIKLQFEFFDEKEPIEIIFFTHILNHISAMPEAEQKARKWEGAISKIISKEIKRIA